LRVDKEEHVKLDDFECLESKKNYLVFMRKYKKVVRNNLQARALYDFEAQPGSGELSIVSGEILIVTR
jgi:hypothetical protein